MSDSQCGPERFPGGGECSPFLPPSLTPSLHGTLKGREFAVGIDSPFQEMGRNLLCRLLPMSQRFAGCPDPARDVEVAWFRPQEFSLGSTVVHSK